MFRYAVLASMRNTVCTFIKKSFYVDAVLNPARAEMVESNG